MRLPSDFIVSMQSLLNEESELFFAALTEPPPVSIRLNPVKTHCNPIDFVVPVEPVKWSQWGYYLKNRAAFTLDPLFHAGYYYVQETSSMFVEHLVRLFVKAPAMCLDLCAAPGGKSISLLSALPKGSLLVCNEILPSRAVILSETVTKFGNPNTVVTNNSPRDFAAFPHFFDFILVDAPCSGEGMFRKDEVAIREWSSQNVLMCATRQRAILSDVWSALKPGGILVYSTCTYNTTENEENAQWIADELNAEFVPVASYKEWNISPAFNEVGACHRFFPHKTKGEGLFVTVLRKNDETKALEQTKNKKGMLSFLKDTSSYTHFLHHPEYFDFLEENNCITALPKLHSHQILSFYKKMRVVSSGIEIGRKKRTDFIPAHALAMSIKLKLSAFTRYDLPYEQAIAYLRRESIVLHNAPKGFVLLTYKKQPLGWVKNIGNRANNLYPITWRIRSQYMPIHTNFPFQNQ